MHFLDDTHRAEGARILALPEAAPQQRADKAVACLTFLTPLLSNRTSAEKVRIILDWDERAGTQLAEDF